MSPTFFADQADFRNWLAHNHQKETELLVGFYKVNSGKPSMSWPESVDQALCFGWIDGVRKSIDGESYTIRFTARKSGSIWSAINIRKIEDLSEKGLMQPAGIASYEKRKEHKSKIYSYETEPVMLSEEFEKRFRENEKAWEFFRKQAPSYQKTAIHIVMRAKREETRLSRLEALIRDSGNGTKLKQLSY
ncbi:MAG: YdeI/OmpD-associated family protein [Dyadobacter sp.]|uniref:YdeI/OmpD-associated family protein n=1 Tax=Dyadobacter sp. TaxID=1914288 RepID=UPI003264590D